VTSESNQVCRRRLIYSQVQSPVLLVTLHSCLGYLFTRQAPMLSCYPVHIMLKFSRIMYAAMLSVTSNANDAIATGTVIVATRYFQESSNRIWLLR